VYSILKKMGSFLRS
jgi:hypothetical protein